jgi:hypothetical protein
VEFSVNSVCHMQLCLMMTNHAEAPFFFFGGGGGGTLTHPITHLSSPTCIIVVAVVL